MLTPKKPKLPTVNKQHAYKAGYTPRKHDDFPDTDIDGHPADVITLDTTNFDKILGPGDTEVQQAMETLDEITLNQVAPGLFNICGFPNRVDSLLSFDDGTRTFTLTPITSFDYYIGNIKYTINTTKTVIITDTQGLWWFYLDTAGVLYASQVRPSRETYCWVGTVYWQATYDWGEEADERHGIIMDISTQSHLHNSIGTQYYSGLDISGYVLDDSANDTSIQVGISSGVIADEDIRLSIVSDTTPTNPYEQNLVDPAQIPVWYLEGAGIWTKDTATDYFIKNTAAGRVNYNELVAGTWQQTQANSTNFVAYWIVATNHQSETIISIQGQRADGALGAAQTNNQWGSLLLYDLPALELRPLYRVIFQTATGYTNTRKARIREIQDIRTDSNRARVII